MANIPRREINFYEVESVEEKIVEFGNYEFEDKFIEAIEVIGDSKFGGPIESNDRNKKRADIMNLSAGFASNASTLYFEDLNDDKIPIDVDQTVDSLREYFVPLFKTIKEFILKNYDSRHSNELRYIFVDAKNQIFKRIFNETFVDEFPRIRMVDVNSNDGIEFSYKGCAYYLYARQDQFRPESVSEEDIDGYYNRYRFFADLRHWLNTNYQDYLAVTSKINTERKAIEKVYKQFNQKFDIKTFNNAIQELKTACRVADQYKEAYLEWRRGWCLDELVAQYIPQVDKRLF
jgi:dimeric dUTPase (all-alpha-NTP-PPase superfamily)